jgi:hypothetical protein
LLFNICHINTDSGAIAVPDRNHFMSQQQSVIDKLLDEGLL